MPHPRRIEGYAIISEDGMLANASGIMPDQLKFEADQKFFERGLDGVDVVVHGRHSHERQRHSDLRRRLILTRKVPAIADDPLNKKALFWNPRRGFIGASHGCAGGGRRQRWLHWRHGRVCSGCFWTVMTSSTCHVHPMYSCLAGGRFFPKCPRELPKRFWLATDSRPAHGRCLMR